MNVACQGRRRASASRHPRTTADRSRRTTPIPRCSRRQLRALQEIDNRYSTSVVAAGRKAEQFAAEPAKTLLMDNKELEQVVKSAEQTAQAQKLDIATLKPGDIIEGRYKFIEKIGKGAFGTGAADGGHGRRRAPDPQVPERRTCRRTKR